VNSKRHAWILILCILVLAILVFFEPSYGWRLRAFFAPRNIISSDDPTLPAQNQALQAQVAQLQVVSSQIPRDTNPANEIRAMVYSQYPFGFKNQLLVNAGTNSGVATGSAVMFQGVFVGTVQSIFSDSAAIQTVFDPSFKMPVRIGNTGVDGLLVGGTDPKVTSIAKDAAIIEGDIVYSAAPALPYGLPIAIVSATSTSADNLFEQASLNFAYDINGIQTVLIERP
jgi:cell shape-determining protein MreC